MKKDKTEKASKREAFMSFLQVSTTTASETSNTTSNTKKANSDNEDCYDEYVQASNGCSICGVEADPTKRKTCGFCNLPACSDHLRKRRKRKNKFERICDNCEDKFLSDSYNKLEQKAEEAMSVAEEITNLKYDSFREEAEAKRQKRREIAFKSLEMQEKQAEELKVITFAENKLMSAQNKIESDELTIAQMEIYVNRLTANSGQNYEQNFAIMTEENSRLAKELAKVEKMCSDIRTSIDKREKEIQEAYQIWEKKQYAKNIAQEQISTKMKKDGGCLIY